MKKIAQDAKFKKAQEQFRKQLDDLSRANEILKSSNISLLQAVVDREKEISRLDNEKQKVEDELSRIKNALLDLAK